MTKKQHYITWEERQQLEAMRRNKIPVAEIARQLGVCRQTIYNEIERGTYLHTCDYRDEERYSAEKAQAIHEYKQTAKGRPLKIGNNLELANFLEEKMLGVQKDGSIDKRKRYSPAAALELARREGYTNLVCVTTLYSYITKGLFLHLTNKDLLSFVLLARDSGNLTNHRLKLKIIYAILGAIKCNLRRLYN